MGDVLAGPGPEERPGGGLQPLTDREHLLGSLALAEDHLGLPLPQGTMVIDAGEGEIFEGKVTQSVERRLGCDAAGGHVGEQSFELLGCHATWAIGSRYSRKIASASPIDSIWKRR